MGPPATRARSIQPGLAWADESHGYAQSAWLADDAQIDENYYRKEIKVVDQRLALAGLRLAAVLNEAFARVQH